LKCVNLPYLNIFMIDNDVIYTINPEPLQTWLRDQLTRTTQNKLAKEMAIARPILSEIL
jgi:hypothetical protein